MPAVRAGFRRLFSIFAISPPPLATAAPAAESEFRRLFSVSAFSPPLPASARPAAERSTNLFVSGLNKRTTSEGLWEAFSKFGQVVHGFGFVRYATLEEAEAGIKGMDGKFLDGWVIFEEYARPRPPPPGQKQF